MSVVFTCECGRKTTEPFVISGRRMCVICAEEIAPEIVDSRERRAAISARSSIRKVPTNRWGRQSYE